MPCRVLYCPFDSYATFGAFDEQPHHITHCRLHCSLRKGTSYNLQRDETHDRSLITVASVDANRSNSTGSLHWLLLLFLLITYYNSHFIVALFGLSLMNELKIHVLYCELCSYLHKYTHAYTHQTRRRVSDFHGKTKRNFSNVNRIELDIPARNVSVTDDGYEYC